MKDLKQSSQKPIRVPGADETKDALEVFRIQVENFRKFTN